MTTNPTISRGYNPRSLNAIYNVRLGSIVEDAQQVLLSKEAGAIYNNSQDITVYGTITINASFDKVLIIDHNLVSLDLNIGVNSNATALEASVLTPNEFQFQRMTGDGIEEISRPNNVKVTFPLIPYVWSTAAAEFIWQIIEAPALVHRIVDMLISGLVSAVIGVIIGVLLEVRLKKLCNRVRNSLFKKVSTNLKYSIVRIFKLADKCRRYR